MVGLGHRFGQFKIVVGVVDEAHQVFNLTGHRLAVEQQVGLEVERFEAAHRFRSRLGLLLEVVVELVGGVELARMAHHVHEDGELRREGFGLYAAELRLQLRIAHARAYRPDEEGVELPILFGRQQRLERLPFGQHHGGLHQLDGAGGEHVVERQLAVDLLRLGHGILHAGNLVGERAAGQRVERADDVRGLGQPLARNPIQQLGVGSEGEQAHQEQRGDGFLHHVSLV